MTNKAIIYENELGKLCLLHPFLDCGLTLEEIALKDVPEGKPFKIVDLDSLPDMYFFNAWEYDFTNNDGVGMGPDKFHESRQKDDNTWPTLPLI